MVKLINKDIIGAGDCVILEKDIYKLANLAKLEVNESELPFYIKEMQAMIDFAQGVDAALSEDIAENTKALDFNNMREDEVSDSLENAQILLNAKDSEDGFFKLRKRA